MGIDNVAIKTFNPTGAQSVCRANEADSSKLIESQFLTKCTTEYINGTGMSIINGATYTLDGTAPPADTFYLPSDCDAISDIIYDGLKLQYIKKIDVYIGQLNVQTIYPHDIYSRNTTELGQSFSGVPGQAIADTCFSIPFIGRAKNKINSFLQAGAMTNEMRLKVSYLPAIGDPTKTSICVVSHNITNTEKNFIAKNIINRPVHTSQGFMFGGLPFSGGSATVDLSGFNINVSHILIYCPKLTYAELILGNDRTGEIPAKLLDTRINTELFSLVGNTANLYIIKTADSAFSTAGIPFSRVNNKKLKLGASDDDDPAYVTVCGTQVQTTVGGTISFSA